MINIMIVDDQSIVLQGLKMILNTFEDINVVATAENGLEACQSMSIYKPDVILMDIKMPIMNGVEAVEKIKSEHEDVKIIILTTFNDDEYIYEGIKNGANGYLLKDTSPAEIAEGIRTVHDGGSLIEPHVATKLLSKFSEMASGTVMNGSRVELNLTNRERDIVHLVGEGLNNQEIGEALFISTGTVKNNITRILDKLELRDRTQLAILAVKNNI